jgi:hypothetical protein
MVSFEGGNWIRSVITFFSLKTLHYGIKRILGKLIR